MKHTTRPPAAQRGPVTKRPTLPPELLAAKRWLLWKRETPSKAGDKELKVPYYALTGKRRSGTMDGPLDTARMVTHAHALATFEQAGKVAAGEGKPNPYAGLGLALGAGWRGCDLDGVRNPETGVLEDWAQKIVDRADTYTEVSPSGKGVHLIFYDDAAAPLTLGANRSGVEFYSGTRYFTFTGRMVSESAEVRPVSADVIDLMTQKHLSVGKSKPVAEPRPGIAPGYEWEAQARTLREKLHRVPAGRGHDRWKRIGMAIHYASGGNEEGFAIWHGWSAANHGGETDDKGKPVYRGEADCRYQWDHFKLDHPNPATWGTIDHYLKEFAPAKAKAATPGRLPMTIKWAGDLYDAEIKPVERLTQGRLELTPGVTVLAGKPKHGKSWLAVGLAVAFVTGDSYLETHAAASMQAVYVACDDPSEIRFQNRLHAIKPKVRPDGLAHITDIDSEAGSSLELLSGLLNAHPAMRFVVIDTLAAFRESQRGDSPYQQEYDEVKALNDWAHQHNVCVLLVHHLRKGAVDPSDPYESISGTLGLQGACDGMMVLARRDLESDVDEALDLKLAGLWYRGRDLDNDVSTGIVLANGRWTVYGRGRIVDVFAAQTRREILRVLESDPKRWWTAKEMHATGEFNCKVESVKRTASRMARSKEIDAQPGHGGGYRARG